MACGLIMGAVVDDEHVPEGREVLDVGVEAVGHPPLVGRDVKGADA